MATLSFFSMQRNFVRKHETTNEYYRPESSDDEQAEKDEGTGNDEVPTLGDLADEVAKRNLEIPRDYITITRVRLGRGQFGEVKQALIRRPDQPEILCAAKMARGMDLRITKTKPYCWRCVPTKACSS